jgi:hypothetical protein
MAPLRGGLLRIGGDASAPEVFLSDLVLFALGLGAFALLAAYAAACARV